MIMVKKAEFYKHQALQQLPWYEKESALAEIEYCQEKLLKELKEYKCKDLEVIQEAIAFASEAGDSNDLILPPYPSWPSHSMVADSGYISFSSSMQMSVQNGGINGCFKNLHGSSKTAIESDRNPIQSAPVRLLKWVKVLIGAAAKTAITVFGVITIFSLAVDDGRRRTLDFPPRKVPVIESGEIQCVVKGRVEVPFESHAATPDVNFGCG